jgi:hypothetical protein
LIPNPLEKKREAEKHDAAGIEHEATWREMEKAHSHRGSLNARMSGTSVAGKIEL